MSSPPQSHHDNQSKTDSAGQASDPNNPPTTASASPSLPPPPHPPVVGYPPPSGYPSASAYPPQYPAYPNGYHQYPYAQAPPAAYYAAQPYPTQHPGARRSSGFLRGAFTVLIIFVVFLCLSSIITWLVLRPQVPEFYVTTFSVSKFNVSGPAFTANWDVNVKVFNPNSKLKVFLDQIQGFTFHEDDDDHFLSRIFLSPLVLNTKEEALMHANLSTGNPDQPMVGSWVVDDMRKKRVEGTVMFSFRMMVWSTLKSGEWWTRHLGMKVYCEHLEVRFPSAAASDGAIAAGKPVPCAVYM